MLPKEALPSFLYFKKRKLHVVYCNLSQPLTNFNEFSEIYDSFMKREADYMKKRILYKSLTLMQYPFSIQSLR